jgi:acetyltransferase
MTFFAYHMLEKVLLLVVTRFMSRGLRQWAYARLRAVTNTPDQPAEIAREIKERAHRQHWVPPVAPAWTRGTELSRRDRTRLTEPAPYPGELDGHIVLPNRCLLRIRPLRQCEEDAVRELYDHLSPRTRFLRFFSHTRLPDDVLRMLARVDYVRRLALVAEHDNGNGSEIVGLASFGAIDDGRVKVALVIRDDWQRQRLGTELAGKILLAAEARGFHRFIANIHSENIASRRLLESLGDVVSTTISGSISEFAFVRRRTK